MTGSSSDTEELKDLQREVAELRAEREKSRATAKRASSAKKTGAEKSDAQKPGTQKPGAQKSGVQKPGTKQKESVTKKPAAQASADEEQAAEPMTEQAAEQADEQTLDAEKKVQEIADQFEGVVNQLEEAARERPALALLAAFTTGVVVGYILTRKS